MKEALHQIGVDVPLEDLLVLDVDDGRADVARDDLLRVVEEVGVVGGPVRVGDDGGDRASATSRTTCALLVVGDLRRHVA